MIDKDKYSGDIAAYFIVLEDAAQPSIPFKNREVACAREFNRSCGNTESEGGFALSIEEENFYNLKPFLLVLMVVRKEENCEQYEWERVGVGHIYRKAIFRSAQWSFEDNFILC